MRFLSRRTLRNIGSLVDFAPSTDYRDLVLGGSDIERLASDVERMGCDMTKAMQRYEQTMIQPNSRVMLKYKTWDGHRHA